MEVVTRLREPRFGMAFLSAVVSLIMALHWMPMVVPGLTVGALAVARPQLVVRPLVWWSMAGAWLVAVIVAQRQMEDHVHLFVAWLVALAIILTHHDQDTLVRSAVWHARLLIGVTFTAAVAWKLYFGDFVSGMTLRLFLLVDGRFEPLATMVGLPADDLEHDRGQLAQLFEGSVSTVPLGGSPGVKWRLMAFAVAALVVEIAVAVSHLAPDESRLAAVRLPSLVVFGVMTYAVVPVLPFAALLGVLALVVARWRREAMWVVPLFVLVAAVRFAFLL